MSKRFGLHHLFTIIAVALLAACGQSANEPAAEQAAPSPDTAAATTTMDSPASTEARLYFKGPADGDVVSNPVAVTFGIDGMAVVPAGQDVPHSGHHHIIIDGDKIDTKDPVGGLNVQTHGGGFEWGATFVVNRGVIAQQAHTADIGPAGKSLGRGNDRTLTSLRA